EDADRLLAESGARTEDLDRLVVGTGPGSFTSTRIRLAVARGPGLPLGLPAAAGSTLDALQAGDGDVFPVLDAGRREVVVPRPEAGEELDGAWYPTAGGRAVFAAEVETPASLAIGAYHDGGVLVGYAIASRYVDAWHVMDIAVVPEFRRRGIGRSLLEMLFEV